MRARRCLAARHEADKEASPPGQLCEALQMLPQSSHSMCTCCGERGACWGAYIARLAPCDQSLVCAGRRAHAAALSVCTAPRAVPICANHKMNGSIRRNVQHMDASLGAGAANSSITHASCCSNVDSDLR